MDVGLNCSTSPSLAVLLRQRLWILILNSCLFFVFARDSYSQLALWYFHIVILLFFHRHPPPFLLRLRSEVILLPVLESSWRISYSQSWTQVPLAFLTELFLRRRPVGPTKAARLPLVPWQVTVKMRRVRKRWQLPLPTLAFQSAAALLLLFASVQELSPIQWFCRLRPATIEPTELRWLWFQPILALPASMLRHLSAPLAKFEVHHLCARRPIVQLIFCHLSALSKWDGRWPWTHGMMQISIWIQISLILWLSIITIDIHSRRYSLKAPLSTASVVRIHHQLPSSRTLNQPSHPNILRREADEDVWGLCRRSVWPMAQRAPTYARSLLLQEHFDGPIRFESTSAPVVCKWLAYSWVH